MKRLIIFLIVLTIKLQAQVGFNTLNPQVTLALGQDNLGINRIGTNHLALVTNGVERMSIPDTGFIGINQTIPLYPLDVNFANTFLKINNLGSIEHSNFRYLAIDSNGLVGKRSSIFAFGQVMRAGAVNKTYNAGSEYDLELFYDVNNLAPNNSENCFNDIPNATINTTNHTISLGKGTYSINLKLIGVFSNNSNDNRANVKLLVNGNEHSSLSSILYGSGDNSVRKMGNFSEVLVVPTDQTFTIKFRIRPDQNNLEVFRHFVPSGGSNYSMRTLVTISRIRN